MAFTPEQGAAPIIQLLENPQDAPLSAYQREKPVNLAMETFKPDNARRLETLTQSMMQIWAEKHTEPVAAR